MNRIFGVFILVGFLLMIDFYAFQAVETAFISASEASKTLANSIFWGISGLGILGVLFYHLTKRSLLDRRIKTFIMLCVFTLYLAKFFMIGFLLTDEIRRIFVWIWQWLIDGSAGSVSRSIILARMGLIAAFTPIIAIIWGVIKGAHDYQIVERTVYLPHLPKAFDGLRIAQISDIHSGSFWDKKSVQQGVKMLKDQSADVVFFTGDLVNNQASEMKEFEGIFSQITAPLGVYSILGNHDYGDYVAWPSRDAKRQNLQNLMDTHTRMGWQLLMNEHRIIERDGAKIAVLGIENWSAKGSFPKYGSLADAYVGTENIPVKLLLSHDPSHWKAEVLSQYKDIDITFSGHTHGMQFGLDSNRLKWSPVQYVYKEWIDLHEVDNQYLYVNRGFGYLGFPGRIGMRPEITIMELRRGERD